MCSIRTPTYRCNAAERAAPRTAVRSACVTSCAIATNERIFTYWDYRAGMSVPSGTSACESISYWPARRSQTASWAKVDRQARKGSGPSDHAGDRRPGRGSGRGDRTSRAAAPPRRPGAARPSYRSRRSGPRNRGARSRHRGAPDRRAAGGSPERRGQLLHRGGRDRARAARAANFGIFG